MASHHFSMKVSVRRAAASALLLVAACSSQSSHDANSAQDLGSNESSVSGWSSMGGFVTSQISLGANADGRLEVFARGSDGALWSNWQWQPGGSWSGWSSFGGTFPGDPQPFAVANDADGRMEGFCARQRQRPLAHQPSPAQRGLDRMDLTRRLRRSPHRRQQRERAPGGIRDRRRRCHLAYVATGTERVDLVELGVARRPMARAGDRRWQQRRRADAALRARARSRPLERLDPARWHLVRLELSFRTALGAVGWRSVGRRERRRQTPSLRAWKRRRDLDHVPSPNQRRLVGVVFVRSGRFRETLPWRAMPAGRWTFSRPRNG